MQQQALSAIVAWVRLDQAVEALNAHLRKDFGVTGLQLAVLRILSERPDVQLATLRKALVMHPATLGQAVDELRRLGFCTVTRDPSDRRARIVSITGTGSELISRAPVAGPVRLRQTRASPQKLERLAQAFDDAVDLFGLKPWAMPKRKEMPQ